MQFRRKTARGWSGLIAVSYLRSQTPDPEGEKLRGPLDIIAFGSLYQYQILSFSVITVDLRNVRVSFWDEEQKTRIYNLFMREDPSIVKTVPAQLAVFYRPLPIIDPLSYKISTGNRHRSVRKYLRLWKPATCPRKVSQRRNA